MSGDTVYYQKGDVAITSALATLGANSYATADLKSASLEVLPAKRAPGIILAVVAGLVSTASAIMMAVGRTLYGPDPSLSFCVPGMVCATPMIIFGIVRAIKARPKYAVVVGSLSGERGRVVFDDEASAREIVQAVNRAMAEHG
jgi:hypothetical protein